MIGKLLSGDRAGPIILRKSESMGGGGTGRLLLTETGEVICTGKAGKTNGRQQEGDRRPSGNGDPGWGPDLI